MINDGLSKEMRYYKKKSMDPAFRSMKAAKEWERRRRKGMIKNYRIVELHGDIAENVEK